jgi:glucosamine-6-phosphate deaminase
VTLDLRRLREWVAVPPDELAAAARVPFVLLDTREQVHQRFADDLYAEIAGARERGEEVSLIIPLGPTGQYPVLARRLNAERMSLDHVTFFGMDEWLDWQARPLSLEHPFSLEGAFRRDFLALVDEELQPRAGNVIFPTPLQIDRSAEEIERRGGRVAGTFGGVGFQGHVAFNEPPASRWIAVGVDDLRDSRTRIVPLSVDTLIAHSHRRAGGNAFAVPPMAVTLGMRELLSAERVRLYVDTGSWKQTILRILLFSEPDVDYPVTLVRDHPDVVVVADRASAAAPPPDALAQ